MKNKLIYLTFVTSLILIQSSVLVLANNKSNVDKDINEVQEEIWIIWGRVRFLGANGDNIFVWVKEAKIFGIFNESIDYNLSFCLIKISKPLIGFMIRHFTVVNRPIFIICSNWDYVLI